MIDNDILLNTRRYRRPALSNHLTTLTVESLLRRQQIASNQSPNLILQCYERPVPCLLPTIRPHEITTLHTCSLYHPALVLTETTRILALPQTPTCQTEVLKESSEAVHHCLGHQILVTEQRLSTIQVKSLAIAR